MAQTATTLANVLKEAWTDARIQKQFYADDGPLTRIESEPAVMIGSQASVPVWTDLAAGGYTSTSQAGGVLNPATNQPVNKAFYTLTQHFYQIALEYSALNQAAGDNIASVVSAKNLEIEGAIASLRNQATRQIVTNGDGIVAACGNTSASTTVNLVASPSGTAYGYDAIVREWLRPGAVIDIGTTADTDAVATGVTVQGVTESASAPAIQISGSAVSTTSGTHYVYIANPNSTTAANPEANGLRNLYGTGALGGLNPATAGQEFWQPALRDTSTSVYSLDLALNMGRSVQQKSGQPETTVWSGLKQQANHYSLLQNQVRFSSDSGLNAGGRGSVKWNGLNWEAFNAILDSDIFFLHLPDIVRVTGGFKAPQWMSSLQGANQGQIWSPGTTQFVDGLGHAFQVGLRRRNTGAAATALTA